MSALLPKENQKRRRIRKRSLYCRNADLVDALSMRRSKMDAAAAMAKPKPREGKEQ